MAGKVGMLVGHSVGFVAGEEGLGAVVLRVIDHLIRRALFDDHALVHEDDLVGHIARECHLVRHDHHGHMLFGKRSDDLQHLLRELGVERRSGLVEEEDIRLKAKGVR